MFPGGSITENQGEKERPGRALLELGHCPIAYLRIAHPGLSFSKN